MRKERDRGDHGRIRFYWGDSDSVLPKKQQDEAQALLERFVGGDRGAFGQFKTMFGRLEKSPALDGEVERLVRLYRGIRGGRLNPGELANIRELSDFLTYHRIGRRDANAAQAAFAAVEGGKKKG